MQLDALTALAHEVLGSSRVMRYDCRPASLGRSSSAPSFGEVAERSKAAVLKTVDSKGSGGSNPSLSANQIRHLQELHPAKPDPKSPI